jgi:pimeloyl-ACP methyl ester carboxylesterase
MLSGEPPLTPADLGAIRSRTLLMAGDADAVSLEDTATLYNGIADAELAVVPGTSHFLLQEKPALCNTIMMDFLTGEPVPGVAPAHRPGASTLR